MSMNPTLHKSELKTKEVSSSKSLSSGLYIEDQHIKQNDIEDYFTPQKSVLSELRAHMDHLESLQSQMTFMMRELKSLIVKS